MCRLQRFIHCVFERRRELIICRFQKKIEPWPSTVSFRMLQIYFQKYTDNSKNGNPDSSFLLQRLRLKVQPESAVQLEEQLQNDYPLLWHSHLMRLCYID